jgi:hypothetical protein
MSLPNHQLDNQAFDAFRNPEDHRIEAEPTSKQTDSL